MSCDTQLELYRPKGWDYVPYTLKCGGTNYHGMTEYCDPCQEKLNKSNNGYPEYYCKHGVDHSQPGDCLCAACEFGE